MFEQLSDRLQGTIKKLKGQSRITEDNISDALREVRMALIEADVAISVVKDIITAIKEHAIGQEVGQKLSPDQAFLKIVKNELTRAMGEENSALNLASQPPAVILMAGLQGSGKTTSAAKLAKKLIHEKKKVAVVSADVYRPAAIQQLETLAGQVNATFIPSSTDEAPESIAARALDIAKKQFFDVLIVDTAGRLHIDQKLMGEIQTIHQAVNPIETLFVVDAMTGQDAANTAKAFHEALPLTGIVLTKIDGDARGGAALSIRHITGKPIKFLGVGEKTDALEAFHPERIASRILGMGDMLGLIEDIEQQVDAKKAQRLAKKFVRGKAFDLEDFREQLQQMRNVDLDKMLEKIPGMKNIPAELKNQHLSPKKIAQQEAIILSMTPQERRFPDLIKGSRKRRIAAGCGLDVPAVNRLLKQFKEMQRQMKKMKGGKMKNMMRGMPPMGGGGMPFK
ncbi:signal recognition particle protein [Suttonella sp. R2A3]|uniref:signal recognition particle protein n=1 Tax=Suttonella sp. R2A3 TaxID=2908648 RepID=UPI001F1A8C7A|nr:signal recognition particle protein [Suttonella sp. R2A3]UJF24353.1 signal recognition particle protein [Suttonella sp. R2A3]